MKTKAYDYALDVVNKVLGEKTDLNGDHKGSWQGLKKPTMSEEGLRATVEIMKVDLDNKASKQDVYNISNGSPKFASSVVDMVDTTRNYVNTTDGYLYTYEGDKFVKSTLKYQEYGLSDKQVTINHTDFITVGKNLFNKEDIVKGEYYSSGSGELNVGTASNGINAHTNFITVKPNTIYSKSETSSVCEYDENNKFIGGWSSSYGTNFTTNEKTKKIKISFVYENKDTFILNEGSSLLSKYEEYKVLFEEMSFTNNQLEKISNYVNKNNSSDVYMLNECLFEFNINPTYMSDHTFVDGELWVFNASNDEHTNYAKINRYKVDVTTKSAELLGSFEHNFGHCNSVDYCKGSNTLIMGNGSSSYDLPGEIYIIPNAKQLKNYSQVNLSDKALLIDVSTLGKKVNTYWGESNGRWYNIIYVIVDDNKKMYKLLLGQGTTKLEKGSYNSSWGTISAMSYNGTYKILDEYVLENNLDVNQGGKFYNGYLYNAIGHSGLWISKKRFYDGTVSQEQLKEIQYSNIDGQVLTNPFSQGLEINEGYLYLGSCINGANGHIRVYKL